MEISPRLSEHCERNLGLAREEDAHASGGAGNPRTLSRPCQGAIWRGSSLANIHPRLRRAINPPFQGACPAKRD
jgi:hypothetical protein